MSVEIKTTTKTTGTESETTTTMRPEPTVTMPNPSSIEYVDGVLPEYRKLYYSRHDDRGSEVVNYDEPCGCRICNGNPGRQKFLRLKVGQIPLRGDKELGYDRRDEVAICNVCVATIAALWELNGRPCECRFEEVADRLPGSKARSGGRAGSGG